MPEWRDRANSLSTSPVGNTSLAQIIGCQLHRDLIAGKNANVVFAHFAGYMCRDDVTVVQFHSEHCIRQRLDDFAFHFNMIFFGQFQS